MADSGFKGKSMKSVANDVAEGYAAINPLFIKKFDKTMIKDLYEHLNKALVLIRNDKIAVNDIIALRNRNLRLQRLHNAMIILKNAAREKRIPL